VTRARERTLEQVLWRSNYVEANEDRTGRFSYHSAATVAILGTAVAQRAAVPKPQDKLALGEPEVTQLLLLMDTDKNGKISKQEWIKFMEAEFDRLDKDKKGQLDAKELEQSKLRVSHPANVGRELRAQRRAGRGQPPSAESVFILCCWLFSQSSQSHEQKPNRRHDNSRSEQIEPLGRMPDDISGKVKYRVQGGPKITRDIPDACRKSQRENKANDRRDSSDFQTRAPTGTPERHRDKNEKGSVDHKETNC